MNLLSVLDTLPAIIALAGMASIVRFGFIDGLFLAVLHQKISNGLSILAKIGSSIGMGFVAYHILMGLEATESLAKLSVVIAGLFPEESLNYIRNIFNRKMDKL